MKQKGLAPIVIVILMAALAVGGYLIYSRQTKPASPQQTTQLLSSPITTPVPNGTEETANWKTYTNANYQISFRYLPNFLITEHYAEPYVYIYFFTSLSDKQKFEDCNYASDCFYSKFDILFQNISNTQQKPIREFLKAYYPTGVDDKYSSTQIDNISALQQINYLGWGNLYNYYVDKGQTILRIGASIDSEFLNLGADKILSTFKFIP